MKGSLIKQEKLELRPFLNDCRLYRLPKFIHFKNTNISDIYFLPLNILLFFIKRKGKNKKI